MEKNNIIKYHFSLFFLWDLTWPPGRFMDGQNLKYFLIFQNPRKKNLYIREIFCYCLIIVGEKMLSWNPSCKYFIHKLDITIYWTTCSISTFKNHPLIFANISFNISSLWICVNYIPETFWTMTPSLKIYF